MQPTTIELLNATSQQPNTGSKEGESLRARSPATAKEAWAVPREAGVRERVPSHVHQLSRTRTEESIPVHSYGSGRDAADSSFETHATRGGSAGVTRIVRRQFRLCTAKAHVLRRTAPFIVRPGQCAFSALVVFVIPKLLAAVAAAPWRTVLVHGALEAAVRSEALPTNWAVKENAQSEGLDFLRGLAVVRRSFGNFTLSCNHACSSDQ